MTVLTCEIASNFGESHGETVCVDEVDVSCEVHFTIHFDLLVLNFTPVDPKWPLGKVFIFPENQHCPLFANFEEIIFDDIHKMLNS